MKKILLSIILLSAVSSYAQQTLEEIKANKNYGWFQHFEAIGRFGAILAHHEEMKDLTKNPFQALELRIGWQTHGEEDFNQKLNYPTYGIGVYSSQFHSEGIGNPSAIFGFIDFPFLRGRNESRFNTSLGVGISYAFNSFDEVDNPENIAIGSYINVYFSLGLNYQWNINDKWAIKPGLNFSHFSNSSTVVPNLGLNMVDASLGVQYRFNPIKRFIEDKYPDYEPPINPTFIETIPDPVWRRNIWYLRFGSGVRQTDDTGDTFYGIGIASLGYQHQVNYTYKVGGGIDVMYDASIPERYWGSKGEVAPNNSEYTVGINVSNALLVGNLELELQIGSYIWMKYDYDMFMKIYLRPGFKYHINDNLFTMVSFKTEYFGQAQYIEWGLGFNLF